MNCIIEAELLREITVGRRMLRLRYRLLRHGASYDIEIELSGGTPERCVLPDVTTVETIARGWLARLAEGCVTPESAWEVMDDLLGE